MDRVPGRKWQPRNPAAAKKQEKEKMKSLIGGRSSITGGDGRSSVAVPIEVGIPPSMVEHGEAKGAGAGMAMNHWSQTRCQPKNPGAAKKQEGQLWKEKMKGPMGVGSAMEVVVPDALPGLGAMSATAPQSFFILSACGDRCAVKVDGATPTEDDGYLCAIMCDFLAGLQRTPSQLWDNRICQRVLSGFGKCLEDKPSVSLGEDTIAIDIRGYYVDRALEVMMTHVYYLSDREPGKKWILVRVGCIIHGCGEGKLKNAVIQLLARDKTIDYELRDTDGATISIRLDGRKDYSSLGWALVDVDDSCRKFTICVK